MRQLRFWAFLAATLPVVSTVSAGTVKFHALGDLPGDRYHSDAHGVSDDGTVAVGVANFDARRAFRWQAGVMDDVGAPAESHAWAASADGRVVVGYMPTTVNAPREAFHWDNGALTRLGDLPGGSFFSESLGVSADGLVVVGSGTTSRGSEGFRWTNGQMQALGDIPGGQFAGAAWGISADGSVIVGQGKGSGGGDGHAYRWNNGTMQSLGTLPGRTSSLAFDVSAGGTVVVGFASDASGQREPFRWENGGMISLAMATGVSANGDSIVGWQQNASGDEAFLWTAQRGLQSMEALLSESGVDLSGWQLIRGHDISADGLTIIGTGINPAGNIEGWIATIPEPATVLALGVLFIVAARWRRTGG
jgi:probable HAF family extracellular repeat protein